MSENLLSFCYLISSVCFIMALRGLSSPKTSRMGNYYGQAGMALAVGATLANPAVTSYTWILSALAAGAVVGLIIAKRIVMTALPQLVAAFHSLVGLAAVCVALGALALPEAFGIGVPGDIHFSSLVEMCLGVIVGAITFSGSIIAFLKLQGIMGGKPIRLPFHQPLNALIFISIVLLGILFVRGENHDAFLLLIMFSLVLGVTLIIPIGGADMPVIVSMLNSYSGWAAAGIGFTLENNLLIITGALVGASGAILSYIMCKGMNRSIWNVVFGGFGAAPEAAGASGPQEARAPSKVGSAEDAAFLLSNSRSVIIVPGYGMAVAQAQHALREMADALKAKGIRVRYAIHPVAGRMPGHMNVLLAEANVPYEDVFELEEINSDFADTDVAFVIGANDVTNPVARTDPTSPIYGMPVLDVERARTTLFIKRSMSAGYAGVDNELFYRDSTMMLFGDAKKMCEHIIKSLE
jgi:NAD(P) transhydrogenase subunit beta